MTNGRKVLRMADQMTAEAKQATTSEDWPDWAGLAWIISTGWAGRRAERLATAMGDAWMARARKIVKALEINAEWRADRRQEQWIARVYGTH